MKKKIVYKITTEYEIRLPFRTNLDSFVRCLDEWKNGAGKELMENHASMFEVFFGEDGWKSFIHEITSRGDMVRLATISMVHNFIIPNMYSYIKEIKEDSGKQIAVVEHSSESKTNIDLIPDIYGYFMPRMLYDSYRECGKLLALDFIIERSHQE